MRRLLGAAVIVLLGTSWAGAVDTRLTLPPDLAPLKARLVVNKDTYTLDPAQKGAEFRKKLRQLPAQNAPGGIQIQRGRIQIRAVPAPAPVPMPGQKGAQRFRRIQVQPAPPNLKKPGAADEKKETKKEEADDKNKRDAKDAKGPKKENKDDVQVQGNVQGVIIISDGQGNTVVKDIVPNEEKKEEKKDHPAKDGKQEDQDKDKKDKKDAKDTKKDDKAKKDQQDVQEFKIQAQGGQIQIQGRMQIQGGVPGGPPQVQVFVLGGPQRPLPPEVDMVLELTNASDREMTLLVGGGRSQLELKLDGPGAVTVTSGGAARVEGRREVKLAPGAVHKIPVQRLQHGRHGQAGSYWTEPGQYKLTATYKARIKATSDKEKDKPVEVTAPPVKVKVVEGK